MGGLGREGRSLVRIWWGVPSQALSDSGKALPSESSLPSVCCTVRFGEGAAKEFQGGASLNRDDKRVQPQHGHHE